MNTFLTTFTLFLCILFAYTASNAAFSVNWVNSQSNLEIFQTSVEKDDSILKVPFDSCVLQKKQNSSVNCLNKHTWLKINTLIKNS
jgi:hypothetical protein